VERPSYRWKIILIAVLIAVGGSGLLAWHLWKSDARIRAGGAIASRASGSERTGPGGANPRAQDPNPAAQKAGPPDPEAVRTATRSAEDAAKAAAELAAK
jgi:hypothetical protein